jgi:DNA-binding NarL/FixJ family response regulator
MGDGTTWKSGVDVNGAINRLSRREREVFNLAIMGTRNEDISRACEISTKTVETHRARINRKLEVHSTAQLILFAVKHGLLTRDMLLEG